MIKDVLKKVKDIYHYPSITVSLETHRTSPDNKQDPIRLKGLVTEAIDRLALEFDKRSYLPLAEKLTAFADKIDHSHNLEGLVLFVNEDVAEFVRVPLKVENRVTLDHTFATRDLFRALHLSAHYYLLTLSGQKARLIEAYSDRALGEVSEFGFPFENTLYTTDKTKMSMAGTEENLIREFFNRVDKTLSEMLAGRSEPVLVAGVARNFEFFKEVTDGKYTVAGHLQENRDNHSIHEIVKDGWPIMKQWLDSEQQKHLGALMAAKSANKAAFDLNDIWQRILEGRADTLFVEENYFQPVLMENGLLTLVQDHKQPGVVDDIADEMIEQTVARGGKVFFVPDGSLENSGVGVALILRY